MIVATIPSFTEQYDDFGIDVISSWCNKWEKRNQPIPTTYSLITKTNQIEVKEDQSLTTMINRQVISYEGPGYLYEFESTLPKDTLGGKTPKEWHDIIQKDIQTTPCFGYSFWGVIDFKEPVEMDDDNTFLNGEYIFVVVCNLEISTVCGLIDPKDISRCVKVGEPTMLSFFGWSDFPQVVAS
jgi:hypothetical protein